MYYNLHRENNYLRHMIAMTENYKQYGYILNNIIIYNEDGILTTTDCGFFDNDIDAINIKNGIYKRKETQKEKSMLQKENFVILNEKEYSTQKGYCLYIYYKNINYKPVEIKKDSLFLTLYYTITDENIKQDVAIGILDNKSKDVLYNNVYKKIDELHDKKYTCDTNIYNNIIKDIKKSIKQYEKVKEEEKTLSIEELISATRNTLDVNKSIYYNNKKMLESE